MPLFIKGNMATGPDLNMATSSGAYAFGNATADHDAFRFAKAREAGLIIMGKTNLGELNGFKDQTISPAWSALGGETASPYDSKVATSRTDESLVDLLQASLWLIWKLSCRSGGWLLTTGFRQ